MGYRSLVILFILLALALNLPEVREFPAIRTSRVLAATLFYPIQVSTHALVSAQQNLFRFMVRSYRLDVENDQLRAKLDSIRAQDTVISYISKENMSLREALAFQNSNPYGFSLIAAEVIGRGGVSLDEEITINKGNREGAKVGMTVISKDGLVGRVIEVFPFTSKIRLIISPGNSISAVLGWTGAVGVARGGYGRKLKLENIPEETEINTLEAVRVSASSSDYLRGVMIGRVSRVQKSVTALFCDIDVKPAVDFSKLTVVFLCRQ